mmetsp:Transcript_8713/g.21117  ORF Transcript_8713/g.21117 Transcript_8713/m.21117 type:complete len:229 (-) Transcript_8713:1626-2312(-)
MQDVLAPTCLRLLLLAAAAVKRGCELLAVVRGTDQRPLPVRGETRLRTHQHVCRLALLRENKRTETCVFSAVRVWVHGSVAEHESEVEAIAHARRGGPQLHGDGLLHLAVAEGDLLLLDRVEVHHVFRPPLLRFHLTTQLPIPSLPPHHLHVHAAGTVGYFNLLRLKLQHTRKVVVNNRHVQRGAEDFAGFVVRKEVDVEVHVWLHDIVVDDFHLDEFGLLLRGRREL